MNVKRIGEHSLPAPRRETDGAAGFDLRSVSAVPIKVPAGGSAKIKTGFAWEIPEGAVGLVCPRSGLAAKESVTVLNAPGIVDSDYRGEVCVLLVNHGSVDYYVVVGDRIAQLVIVPLHAAGLHRLYTQEALGLSDTERGEKGFGSTGMAA